jgi:ribosomal-protein-alanine N-acetyltransferase
LFRITIETLYTERLTLRPFTSSDASDIFSWASDPRVTMFLGFQPHESIDRTKEVLAGWIAAYDDENHYS